ncbi:hypothetical protein QBC37DRAFT_189759 [Rhypophila decipiens]|uniref:Phospholipase n=1 Tax=Rhypophila decipiens TaxID=261697 RepID=A0AAN6YH56_9PEZI|nr:hypothetical protein QBC37DRAFT_189759 [Rhypophila decipiens]
MVFGSFLKKLGEEIKEVGEKLENVFTDEKHSHTHFGHGCHEDDSHAEYSGNRYCSFAPQSSGQAKWYVDGASYFWAVSMALEEAKDYIYILDWWLTPETYLRRPPAKNERYRLDKMLLAAAERGVKVRIIVYKEVEKALTLNSMHTRRSLEALHPNIRVFRHPDHYPSGGDAMSTLQSLKNFSFNTFNLAQASRGAVEALYGMHEDVVLFWAHHEKLCLVDGKVAFMGGLDICFGRWDTNSHAIADAHPGNLDDIVFPGQDYNNARIYDFEDVSKWENNKLDRTKSSRMGWADISISLSGPIVESLLIHFGQRWNYIFDDKYAKKNPDKYQRLEIPAASGHGADRPDDGGDLFGGVRRRLHHLIGDDEQEQQHHAPPVSPGGGAHIQLARSASPWSHGMKTEHSIATAYMDAIKNAKHYVYIENQFFITASAPGDEQKPVRNKIGGAIVDRIIKAHENRENFHVFVLMPAVPAFAGDLKSEGALGTRAIMEFQYNSISRGGHSIIQSLKAAGVEDPSRYIKFYNLRNYDRINTSATMAKAEGESGVSYESARRNYDNQHQANQDYQPNTDSYSGQNRNDQYNRYQEAARRQSDNTWDSVAASYMHGGPDLHSIPWDGTPESELDAFVSEQLYIHSKVLIADDRLVICGSANLNDRSQLGDHDSEIAVIIEDPTPVQSFMNGQQYTASAFAASLRRQLFRKHLGLLPHQPCDAFDKNWTPVTKNGNDYDWGSPADRLVADPLDSKFLSLWSDTARKNTEIFSRAFHPVPNDKVRTWEDYDNFFSKYFVVPGEDPKVAEKGYQAGKVDYGHVVREEFPGGVRELKDWLNGVRGSLVDMPLDFLVDVDDIAKEGTLALNSITQELYT